MERDTKKSDSIEVRVPHAVKRAFMERCRREGLTASAAIRAFVEAEIEGGKPMRVRSRLRVARPAVAGIAAALAAALVIGPATVSAAPDFGPGFAALDHNHDGAISPGEYGDPRPKPGQPGCGKGELLLPLARESMPEVHGIRPFAVKASDFIFATVDSDHDNRISRQEYAKHWLQILRKGFERFDTDRDGTISRREYTARLQAHLHGRSAGRRAVPGA